MEEWVNLKTMLEQKPNFSRRYIDYVPDESWTTSQTCENGYNWQYFETEYDLGGYHAFLYKEEVYLVSVYATRTRFKVKGEKAYEEMLSSMAKIHSIYGCKQIQAEGRPLTSKILAKMPKHLRECYKRPYWLCERARALEGTKALKHVVARGNIITQGLLITEPQPTEVRRAFSIRPLILLPPNTYVDIGSKANQGTFEKQALTIALDK